MRWWLVALVFLVASAVMVVRIGSWWRGLELAKPLPVPSGDQEIAWMHIPTSGETWEHFVWGLKRAEMATTQGLRGLRVDDAAAFPDRTTAVPEVVISRDGFAGRIRVRWYKITDYAATAAWVQALAQRDPAPLAIVGGWSSDRARELAEAMASTAWPGEKPLLLLATATAESVYLEEDSYRPDYQPPKLLSLYERSYRFCFTNRQMADAVTDFVMNDPELRPGPVVLPGLRLVPSAAAGPRAILPGLAEMLVGTAGVPVLANQVVERPGWPAFAMIWKDDPYSLDLAQQFRAALAEQGERPGRPRVFVESSLIPFSTGRLNRPNPFEAQVVDHILANLPRRAERTLLVIPTVTTPARRVLSALALGTPGSARRLVAITGDGIPINALFRDGDVLWPVRSIPIPLVLFTHANPFDWDEPGSTAAPPGYELPPPTHPGEVKNSTEDIQLFTLMGEVLVRAAFPDDSNRLIPDADALLQRFQTLDPPFFDCESGNRLAGSGEYVIVLRPAVRADGVVTYPDAHLEVWTRPNNGLWTCIHTRPIIQTNRFGGGANE
ncbi:MAG: hypothetical protein RMJ56_10400 [Gemmataceae bacterium]|nr:hypothetical protein [Gemmata sp.]MDW8198000.1 hypothetical protein [Gemmataceae bacterium]